MRKRLVALAIAGVLALGMTGCGADQAAGGYDEDDRGVEHVIPDTTSYVKKIDVDGTTCIIFNDVKGGGISCNWEVDSTN